jgi:hypothetical protein
MNWFSTDFPLRRYLIIDIETVPAAASWSALSPAWQKLWSEKAAHQLPQCNPEQAYDQRAGIWAEFGRVICIGLGYFSHDHPRPKFHHLALTDTDERKLLLRFIAWLEAHQHRSPNWIWCGHHIREFDLPFLCRRMLANQLSIPDFLDFQSSKPWDQRVADTFQGWRFGDHKHFTSLALLSAVLGLPSSKAEMAGSDVARVFKEPGGLDRISSYCLEDVRAVAEILQRFRGEPVS